MPRKELLKRVKGVDALLSLLNDRIDEEVFRAAGPKLKIVANYAVGFDNIDLGGESAKRHRDKYAGAGSFGNGGGTHLRVDDDARASHHESNAYARAEKYKGWGPNLLLGTDVYGKTLGIVGLGRIGEAVAERAVKGFKMKCVYRRHETEQRVREGVRRKTSCA